jgi:hypothetical protein
MNPFRFAIGAICALAIAIAWMGPQSEPTPSVAPTAPQTSIVTLAPTPPTVTTTTQATTTTSTTTSTTTPKPMIGLVGPDTPCQEWLPMMLEEGWAPDKEMLETALYIMYRESRCQPDADSGPDHGLFQVNVFWTSDRSNPPNWLAAQGIAQTHDQLFDPRTNIRAALAIYNYSCNRNGADRCFAPWTTWSGN